MTPEHCWGFKVFPPEEFYPIHYHFWQRFFETNYTQKALELSEKSTAVHFWNSLSIGTKIQKSGPETAYGAIAAKHCPKAFEAAGEYF